MQFNFTGLVPTFYVDKIGKKDSSPLGRAFAFYILILKSHKDKKGIHAHEVTHVTQVWKWTMVTPILSAWYLSTQSVTLGVFLDFPFDILSIFKWELFTIGLFPFLIHPFLYRSSKKYRYWAELQAFRAEIKLKHGHDKQIAAASFARSIVTYYKLDHLDIDEVKSDLLRGLM